MTSEPSPGSLLTLFVKRYSAHALADRSRLRNFLADHMPESKSLINALTLANAVGAYDRLSGSLPENVGLEIEKISAELVADQGIREDIASWATRVWASSLQLIPDPGSFSSTPSGSLDRKPPDSWQDDTWVSLPEGTSPPRRSNSLNQLPAGPEQNTNGGGVSKSRFGVVMRVVMWIAAGGIACFVALAALGFYIEAQEKKTAPAPTVSGTPKAAPQQSFANVPALADAKAPDQWPELSPEKQPDASVVRFRKDDGTRAIFYSLSFPIQSRAWRETDPVELSAATPSNADRSVLQGTFQEWTGPKDSRYRRLILDRPWVSNALSLPSLCLVLRMSRDKSDPPGEDTICVLDRACKQAVSCAHVDMMFGR